MGPVGPVELVSIGGGSVVTGDGPAVYTVINCVRPAAVLTAEVVPPQASKALPLQGVEQRPIPASELDEGAVLEA